VEDVPTERELCQQISIAKTLAEQSDWEFDCVSETQIAMAVVGQWRTYSLTLAWTQQDETLRLICTFEQEVPDSRRSIFYDVLNRVNDLVWTGAFTYWSDQSLMVWRYGLILSGCGEVEPEQVADMVASAIKSGDCFYPAFQTAAWGDSSAEAAMQVALPQSFGRA
jgi:hypothetical protein